MAQIKLSGNDRDFFRLVSQAAFANPFSEERAAIDRKITGIDSTKPWKELVPEVLHEVFRRISKLDEGRGTTIADFQQADREIMEYVFLFDVFHKFIKQFDQLILDQIDKPDESLTVPFAEKAMSLLVSRGITAEIACRYFSLFYQIRRAFHFIDRGLIGLSDSMRRLRMNLWNNIFTYDIRYYERHLWDKMEDFSTILLGPTGCGKGAAAAAIGRSGFIRFDRKKRCFAESFVKTFISINISQYPEALLESELFGHTKGAFTGAVTDHEGILALCGPYGSIFLDEVGEINTQIQVKLLQVLQERTFSPVGSHKKMRFSGRVTAATNRSLDELREQGKLRDDFYYRLCSDCVTVPSLVQRIRENPNELREMAAHTVERITGYRTDELIGTVLDVIDKTLGRDYHWPGNVRELEQCIRRIIIKREYRGDSVCAAAKPMSGLLREMEKGGLDAQELLAAYCGMLYEKYGTYEQVAKVTAMDRRTVKKYIQNYMDKQ